MGHDYEKPSLLARIQASCIDLLFLLISIVCFSLTLASMGTIPNWVRMAGIGAILLYEPLLTTYACTIGQKLMRIRVLDYNTLYGQGNEKKLALPMSVWRFMMKSMMGWLSFITIHLNAERRAIHDFAASSVMIRVGRKVPA